MNAHNQILTSLSADVRDRLLPHCNSVTLAQGDVIYRPGETLTQLYFPINCLLSVTITMEDGSVAEVGMVGRRGMLGIHAFLSNQEIIQTECAAQVPGEAVKIAVPVLRQEFDRNGELRDVLLRYAQAFVAQVSQTAACNSLHTLEQRLPRWLLEVQSRIGSDELPLTQEFIATMLGVRRAGVTQTAQRLQERKLIQYHRGHVQILNQAGLEASACECFKTVQGQYNRLLGEQ
ncbi:MAG TPA: Crp/Fnr family transcriptional regulator [Trichocoleus sp.]